MSQNPDCPYCGSSVSLDHARVGYDEKVKVRCRNCGGEFEYMPGFGSFSIPGEGPRTQPQRPVRTEGSYPGTVYEGDPSWTSETPRPKQSGCGTCCTICCCCLLLPIIFWVTILGGFFWWIFG